MKKIYGFLFFLAFSFGLLTFACADVMGMQWIVAGAILVPIIVIGVIICAIAILVRIIKKRRDKGGKDE